MSSMAVQLGFEDEHACAQCCPNLTYQQRILGFVACSGIGWTLSTIGSFILFDGFSEKNVTTFILLYILGTFMGLGGTLFLCGPKKQCIKMWDKTRRWSTGFYLSMLLIVFCVAVTEQHIAIIISMLFVEILAAVWYSASYIPFGRKMILGCLRASICGPCFATYDYCADKCGKANDSVQKAVGMKPEKKSWFGGSTQKKQNNSWFGGEDTSKQNNSWFGGEDKSKQQNQGGFFGSTAKV